MPDPEPKSDHATSGMVSTVITSFNKGPYLAEAIESALCQDYEPQEIIVVDDGSTDDTREVARTFGERIRYRFQPNQGPAAAKNRGIVLGSGEYVAFLDGDDRWRPGKLRRQVEAFGKDPRVGVVYGLAATMSSLPDEAPRPRSHIWQCYRGRVLDELIVKNFVPFSSAIVRRRCINSVGLLDPRERVTDDYEFWLRMALQFEFEFVADIVVDFREGIDQIQSRVSHDEFVGHALRVQREFVARFFGGKYPRPRVFRKGIAAKYAGLGDCLLGADMQFRAAVAHARALCMDPTSLARYYALVRDFIPNPLVSGLKSVLSRAVDSRCIEITGDWDGETSSEGVRNQ